MSRLSSIYKLLTTVGLFAAVGGAWAQGRPIEFSTPRDESISADLHQSTQISSPIVDQFRAPESLMPKSSLQGLKMQPQMPPTTEAPLTASQKAMLERKRNWAFVKPEDLIQGVSEEDIFNLKKLNALENPELNMSPVERYYDQQYGKKKSDRMDGSQAKKTDSRLNLDDTKNTRAKSATDVLFGEMTDRKDSSFLPDNQFSTPKKGNEDFTSYQNPDPFSSASYGPDASPKAQQARSDIFRKLYGLPTDSDAPKSQMANSPGYTSSSDLKPKKESAFQTFYGERAPLPVVGSIAPVAPTKPSMEPVITKPSTVFEKNPLFTSPSTALPKRPFQ